MKKIYLLCLILSFLSISFQGHAENSPLGDKSGSSGQRNNDGFVGEFSLDREAKDLYALLPGKKEYERIDIQQKNGKYEVVYYGVALEGDHNYIGFFVVAADDVHIEGNEISFSVGNRDFYPPEHAPRNLEDVRLLKKYRTGGVNDTMLMKGTLKGRTLTFKCESDECYSDVMVFNRK